MRETAEVLVERRALIDRSHAGTRPHPRAIAYPDDFVPPVAREAAPPHPFILELAQLRGELHERALGAIIRVTGSEALWANARSVATGCSRKSRMSPHKIPAYDRID